MKNIYFIFVVVGLVGCVKPTTEWTGTTTSLKKVKGLEDCTVTIVTRGGGSSKDRVYRCPNSTTTSDFNCTKRRCDATLTVVDGDVVSPSDLSDNSSVESKH